MRLSAIEIHGFKSFARRTRLTFDKGITAIIGPNGSGKSCIADSIRWVLGEQSMKQLRSKQHSDIIYSGKGKKSRRASVTLTFDNESGTFPIESPEVAITRTVYSSGESEYAVNNEPVRLLDLQQMLAEAGIGVKSYTVISQGMVDQYLVATPQKRQELFDEATGVRALQIKMTQAQRKLQKTIQHEQELQAIMQEIEPRLTILKRQVDRHDKRVAYEGRLEAMQRTWFHHEWHTRAQHMNHIESQLQDIADRIASAQKLRKDVEQQLVHHPRTDDKQQHLHEQLETAKREYSQAREEYRRVTCQKEELTASLREVQSKRKGAERLLEKKRNESLQLDFFSHTKSVLSQCKSVLQLFINGDIPQSHAVQPLLKKITSLLDTLSGNALQNTAYDALKILEEPLQDVARMGAIEEERLQQLASLPMVSKPSRKRVEQFEVLVREHVPSDLSFVNQLEDARMKEVESERESGAAGAALEQAQHDLHQLERDILRELGTEELSLIQHTPPDASDAPTEQELQRLMSNIASLGEVDPLALKEYEETLSRYEHLTQQMQDITHTRNNITRMITQLEQHIRDRFETRFSVIQAAFDTYFTKLFGGGKAALCVTESGVDITVKPPDKQARNVNLLSGGEKTLTSLALLLAVLEASKPPFIVLDEVDAALDEANSARFAHILREHHTHSQFIVISHNRETMAQADVLYGVTMQQDGISQVYSVELEDVEEYQSEGEPIPQERMHV